jgi:hypothetical protein
MSDGERGIPAGSLEVTFRSSCRLERYCNGLRNEEGSKLDVRIYVVRQLSDAGMRIFRWKEAANKGTR